MTTSEQRDACGSARTVFVEAPGRLHFGLLDLCGAIGRRFGGIGAAAPGPTLLVSATAFDALEVDGEDAERAATFARLLLAHHGIDGGARLCVHRTLPAHAGLGSGTQLSLAVARALAEIHGITTDTSTLARAVGRARRSAIGTWTFDGGGLVLEGGRRPESDGIAPLLARLPFPPTWQCVVAVPDSAPGISGIVEGQDAGVRLAERVRASLGAAGSVYEGPFRMEGARVWHARS